MNTKEQYDNKNKEFNLKAHKQKSKTTRFEIHTPTNLFWIRITGTPASGNAAAREVRRVD